MDDFEEIKNGIICSDSIIYADWTASGRLFAPIESRMTNLIAPYFANTHTTASEFGKFTGTVYKNSRNLIRSHCKANADDILITGGAGMTTMVRKLQRILGIVENARAAKTEEIKARVFISHVEHHSNHLSWIETLSEVIVIAPPSEQELKEGILVSEKSLLAAIAEADAQDKKYSRSPPPLLIGAFSACSNVIGVETEYYKLSKIMHAIGGYCFVDFACSAPYSRIDMHPEKDPHASLDAIYFSGHKFLGGPGSCGVLLFSKKLYNLSNPPDLPGGGTVNWTNPWGGIKYETSPEAREDGGTPSIIQTIRLALCIRLKDQMGVDKMHQRDAAITNLVFQQLEPSTKSGITILQPLFKKRLPIFAMTFNNGLHYNLATAILSDTYKIQGRGGCSCAGTFGHYIFDIKTPAQSKIITDNIDAGNMALRPGWLRISFHPTISNREVLYVCQSLIEIAQFPLSKWKALYTLNISTGEFTLKNRNTGLSRIAAQILTIPF
jgi:selenocysteine lyase/cysteine desulfurase